MRLRLLPRDPEVGWTPYVWLVYLSMFFVELVAGDAGAGEWWLSLAAVALFLALYFRGYWGPRGLEAWAVVGGITAIGAVFLPFNPGASVFFIYAAAYLGYATTPRRALAGILALELLLALEAWRFAVPPYGWIPGVAFVALIGLTNIHFAENSRKNAALRQARAEVEQLAKLAERERIARDLHDLLGHTLSVISLKAELAERLAPRDPAGAQREIAEVAAISRQALAQVRRAVTGYREVGLAEALAAARQALAAGEVELDERTEPVALAPQAESVLALALREAVTNVLRHARASRCAVRLERSVGEVRLEVSDDGLGGATREGEGLRGMRERVEALGGTVERSVANGTLLRVVLPVPAPALARRPPAAGAPA
jgi:two-component system sensor histidine kinase DesK